MRQGDPSTHNLIFVLATQDIFCTSFESSEGVVFDLMAIKQADADGTSFFYILQGHNSNLLRTPIVSPGGPGTLISCFFVFNWCIFCAILV